MTRFEEVARGITDNLPKVLEEWRKFDKQEPWLSLPANFQLDALPELIEYLTRAALVEPESLEARRRHVYTAAKHGQDRFEQGFPEHFIFTEHHLLRRSLRRFVDDHLGHSLQLFEAVARLDVAVTISTIASLRGYHRATFEARGEWPATLEKLLEEWSIPPA